MSGLLPGESVCGICGSKGRCFQLDSRHKPSDSDASLGCLACLRADRFGFFHVTEAGYLDEKGLTWYGEEPRSSGRVFVVSPTGESADTRSDPLPLAPEPPCEEAIDELRRTPEFHTWNEVPWPIHCNDFMVYLGTWQPRDIAYEAKLRGESAAEFFVSMTDEQHRGIWPGDTDEWGLTFHVFRCTQCGSLIGRVDLD